MPLYRKSNVVSPQNQLWVNVVGSDINLLGSVGTKVDLYTVPTGYRFICDQYAILITGVTQSGTMSGAVQPSTRAVKNNSNAIANQISNEIAFSDAGQVVQIVNKYWRTGGQIGNTAATTGKATATAGEVISAYITAQATIGTNGYTTFTGKPFLSGWLFPV